MLLCWLRVFSYVVLLWCVGSSCQREQSNPKTTPPNTATSIPLIEGYIVKPTELRQEVELTGTVLPAESTELHPETSGKVVALYLPEGKLVAKGTLLVKLNDAELQAQLQKIIVQQATTTLQEQRLAELLKIQAVSKQEYEAVQLQLLSLEADLALIKAQIAKTEIRAPFDGVVGLRSISLGSYVSPTTQVAVIRDVKQLKLNFNVPEKYADQVKAGTKVYFQTQSNAQIYEAVVIASEESIAESTRTLMVRARVTSATQGLKPGVFAHVKLPLAVKKQSYLIPAQAVIPQAREKKVVVTRNGLAEFITVKTGVRTAKYVEIIEGLSADDTVAVTGILFLKPQIPLKFSSIIDKNL